MNINISLPGEIAEKIQEKANTELGPIVEDILKNDESLHKILRDTIQKQVKNAALLYLQSPELRCKMAQKVYPIIYETLGLAAPKEEQNQ